MGNRGLKSAACIPWNGQQRVKSARSTDVLHRGNGIPTFGFASSARIQEFTRCRALFLAPFERVEIPVAVRFLLVRETYLTNYFSFLCQTGHGHERRKFIRRRGRSGRSGRSSMCYRERMIDADSRREFWEILLTNLL